MLDFLFILIIIFIIFAEIRLTIFCVKKLIILENKVNEAHIQMLENAKKIIEINDEIRKTVSKINKIIRIITNKKFHEIKRIIMFTIDIIQIITLIRTLDLSKGLKSINYKLIKKLALVKAGQEILKKILNLIQNLCAI